MHPDTVAKRPSAYRRRGTGAAGGSVVVLAPVSVSVGYPETRKHGNTHTPQGSETRKHRNTRLVLGMETRKHTKHMRFWILSGYIWICRDIQISRYPDIQISRYPDIQIYPAPMSGHRSSETQKHRNTDPDDTSRAGNTETQKHSTAYRGPKHGNTKHKTETRKH